ncbi:MAG: CHAD domain-containing protein [Bryobacteraceae bacterium]|jgi:CHAD domain-containing protein
MAYRLERGESVISGLKRVVREEIESAGAHLSGKKKATRDESIHDARKSLKKVRATLRLVRGEMGESYRRENARLRDIAARLSEFRDAFAIIGTFDDLKKKFKDEGAGTKLRSVRAGLIKRRDESGREEDVGVVLNAAAAALNKASKRVKRWPLKTDGYKAIARGLEDTYRNGREALARARKDPSAENFHQLRKRVKDHWYHVRLLEGLWAEVMGAYEKSLKDLEDWLGSDHNLTVLRDRIAAEPAFFGKETAIELTFDLIARYQKDLRANAIPLAERIYEEKPRDFTRRIKHLWDTWQAESASDGAN